MKYSRIQYFFWLLSGCEINVLKDCPTDYNRQAGIGFTIFMTSLLGFFSGCYAGWYFGESYLLSILFGTLWSALIFSIDRSMVITMKKDPNKDKQDFWAAFLSRAILSVLIAFIISIPLELLIFSENIELHMDKYKLDQTYNIQNAVNRNSDVASKEKSYARDSTVKSELVRELAGGEPVGDPEYNGLKEDISKKETQYRILLQNYNFANGAAIQAYNAIPKLQESGHIDEESPQYFSYTKKNELRNQSKKLLDKFDLGGLNVLKDKKSKYLSKWVKDKKVSLNRINNAITDGIASIDQDRNSADSAGTAYTAKIKEKKGFVLRYMILEDLATTKNSKENPAGSKILLLLWLIRILFFTIEILPTIAKIATPVGAYDFAIYQKELDFRKDLEKKTNDFLSHQQKMRDREHAAQLEQLDQQSKIENELHKKLLKEIALTQGEVARMKIEEFREQHLKKPIVHNGG